MALMLKDSRTAANTFRLNSTNWDGVPKPKFLYYVRFMKSGGSGNTDSGTDWTKGVGVLAHTVKRPSITFETETLNQYNKKRVIQKKQEFDEISVTFHDTVDQRAFNMFYDYYRFYYGEPRHEQVSDWSWDIMSATMKQAGNWGFIPPAVDPDYSYYFSHIELYYIYGKTYTQINIIHPKITSMDLDDLSYDEGNGTLNITTKFAHEGFIYVANNKALPADLVAEMGLDRSGYYEAETSSPYPASSSAPYTADNAAPMGFDLASVFNGGNAAAPSSTNNNRSDGLTGLNNSFNSVLNGLLGANGTNSLLDTNGVANEENIANRLVDGLT